MQGYIFLLMMPLFGSIIYKAYLDIKIEDPDRKVSIFSIRVFKKYYLSTFFPRRTETNNEIERKLRRKANRSLLVFYTTAVIIFLLAMLEPRK